MLQTMCAVPWESTTRSGSEPRLAILIGAPEDARAAAAPPSPAKTIVATASANQPTPTWVAQRASTTPSTLHRSSPSHAISELPY